MGVKKVKKDHQEFLWNPKWSAGICYISCFPITYIVESPFAFWKRRLVCLWNILGSLSLIIATICGIYLIYPKKTNNILWNNFFYISFLFVLSSTFTHSWFEQTVQHSKAPTPWSCCVAWLQLLLMIVDFPHLPTNDKVILRLVTMVKVWLLFLMAAEGCNILIRADTTALIPLVFFLWNMIFGEKATHSLVSRQKSYLCITSLLECSLTTHFFKKDQGSIWFHEHSCYWRNRLKTTHWKVTTKNKTKTELSHKVLTQKMCFTRVDLTGFWTIFIHFFGTNRTCKCIYR